MQKRLTRSDQFALTRLSPTTNDFWGHYEYIHHRTFQYFRCDASTGWNPRKSQTDCEQTTCTARWSKTNQASHFHIDDDCLLRAHSHHLMTRQKPNFETDPTTNKNRKWSRVPKIAPHCPVPNERSTSTKSTRITLSQSKLERELAIRKNAARPYHTVTTRSRHHPIRPSPQNNQNGDGIASSHWAEVQKAGEARARERERDWP